MSFLSVLKVIGNVFTKVAGINTQLQPIISAIPGGAAFETIFNTVVSVEQMVAAALGGTPPPSSPALSAAKKALADQIIASTPEGSALTPETRSAAIDNVVTHLNGLQAIQTTVAGGAA